MASQAFVDWSPLCLLRRLQALSLLLLRHSMRALERSAIGHATALTRTAQPRISATARNVFRCGNNQIISGLCGFSSLFWLFCRTPRRFSTSIAHEKYLQTSLARSHSGSLASMASF